MHISVCLCERAQWLACEQVHTRVRVFCQPRGHFLSLARRCSHHWTDGQHPPSLLSHPFIYPPFSSSISVSPAAPQTPHHPNPSFPTSQHPSIPLTQHTSPIINQSAPHCLTFSNWHPRMRRHTPPTHTRTLICSWRRWYTSMAVFSVCEMINYKPVVSVSS